MKFDQPTKITTKSNSNSKKTNSKLKFQTLINSLIQKQNHYTQLTNHQISTKWSQSKTATHLKINQPNSRKSKQQSSLKKKKDHWPQKLQNFSKTNPIWPYHFNQTNPIIPMITKQSPNSKFQRHIKKQQNQLNCAKSQPK